MANTKANSFLQSLGPEVAKAVGQQPGPEVRLIELAKLFAVPQIRKVFDKESLKELAADIRNRGVIQPIIAKWDEQHKGYKIIAGERRFRAAKLSKLDSIPVIVKPHDISAQEELEIQVVENLQRENLNAIEEANAYQSLMDANGCSPKEVGKQVGKNESTITRALRLLTLPNDIQRGVANGTITKSVARELARFPDEHDMRAFLKEAQEGRISRTELAKVASESLARPQRVTKKVKRTIQPSLKLTFDGGEDFEIVIRHRATVSTEQVSYEHVKQAVQNVLDEVTLRLNNNVKIF